MRSKGMKALVLSGGIGRRLKPLTDTTTKQLLPVASRPILFYIFVAQFQGQNIDALLLLKEVDNASDFGIAEANARGKVVQVQEKPLEPQSNLALAGIYLFPPVVHEVINFTQPSPRGELEITDAIQKLIDMGKVEIMRGTLIESSIIQGPTSIAENCLVKQSSVGPFASIGPATIMEESSVEDSIVLANCHIQRVKHIRNSLLGKGVELLGNKDENSITNLLAGDNAHLEI